MAVIKAKDYARIAAGELTLEELKKEQAAQDSYVLKKTEIVEKIREISSSAEKYTKEQITTYEQKIKLLSDAVKAAETEVARAKQAVDQKVAFLAATKKENDELTRENRNLNSSLDKTTGVLEKRESELSEFKSLAQELKGELRETQGQLSDLQKIEKRLRQENENLTIDFKKYAERTEVLEQANKDLVKEYSEKLTSVEDQARISARRLQNEQEASKNELGRMQIQLEKWQKEADGLGHRLENVMNERSLFEKDKAKLVEQLMHQINEQEQENKQLQDKLIENKTTVEQDQALIAQLKLDLNDFKKLEAAIRSEKEFSDQRNQELCSKLQEELTEYKKTEAALRSEKALREQRDQELINQLQAKISGFDAEILKERELNQTLHARLNFVEEEHDVLKRKEQEENQELASLKLAFTELSESTQANALLLAQEQKTTDQLRVEVKLLEKIKEDLDIETGRYKLQIQEIHANEMATIEKMNKLNTMLMEEIKKDEELQKQLEGKAGEISVLNQTIVGLRSQQEYLKVQIKAAEDKEKEANVINLARINELEILFKEEQSKNYYLEQEKIDLGNQIKSIQEKVVGYQQELKLRSDKTDDLLNEMATYQQEMSEMNAKVTAHELSKIKLDERLQKLNSVAVSFHEENQKLHKELERYYKMAAELKSKIYELQQGQIANTLGRKAN